MDLLSIFYSDGVEAVLKVIKIATGIGVGIIIILIMLDNTRAKPAKKKRTSARPAIPRDIKYIQSDEDFWDDFSSCYIAGVKHHRRESEQYIGRAIIYPDYLNPHDKNAQGIYLPSGELVGYWPKAEQPTLRKYRNRCGYTDPATLCLIDYIHTPRGWRTNIRIVPPKSAEYIARCESEYRDWRTNKRKEYFDDTHTINITFP